jgi:hypothetical protein
MSSQANAAPLWAVNEIRDFQLLHHGGLAQQLFFEPIFVSKAQLFVF